MDNHESCCRIMDSRSNTKSSMYDTREQAQEMCNALNEFVGKKVFFPVPASKEEVWKWDNNIPLDHRTKLVRVYNGSDLR